MPKNGEIENKKKPEKVELTPKKEATKNKKKDASSTKTTTNSQAKKTQSATMKQKTTPTRTKINSKSEEKKGKNKDEQNGSVSEKKINSVETITERKMRTNSNNSSSKTSTIVSKTDFKTLEVIVLVLLTCVISLIVGGLLAIKFDRKGRSNNSIPVVDDDLQYFLEEYNYLIENYYGEIDRKELLNTAFKSMVDSLEDSYTGTIDETTSNNFDIELEGKYEGLGIEIINDPDNNILIYGIIPNSPASKVDLQKNDQLISVNGQNVSGMSTTDFINQIIKKSDVSEFTMLLKRNENQHTVVLKREAITLQSVTSKIYEEGGKKIGFLKVKIFAANTYNQFKTELNNLENSGIESLIIDLRDNSGGHLTSVQNMISLFLDSSHVIYQVQDKNKTTKVYSTGNETKEYSIVVLGNSMSASASEVMISALTEEQGAILIGNQTFGKGTVQELHSLSNGDEYKFTTKKWLTPKGNWIHNEGIKPTIDVVLSQEYYENPIEENDNQLKSALDYLRDLK